MKSDAVIHLAQWQYWWWFWFAFLWGFYYLVTSKVVRGRMLKFRPKIYTSYRSHGKWGDFLACIVPAIWCLNILTNSSFIMRLLEWQYELSLFNIRIRGRQWYWVYKFELRHILDFASVPRNVGHNKWVVSAGGLHLVTDDYFHALKVRTSSGSLRSYWEGPILSLTRTLNDQTLPIPTHNRKLESYVVSSLNFLDAPFDMGTIRNVGGVVSTAIYPSTTMFWRNSTVSTAMTFRIPAWSPSPLLSPSALHKLFISRSNLIRSPLDQRLASIYGDFTVWQSFFKPITLYADNSGKLVPPFDSNRSTRRVEIKSYPIYALNAPMTMAAAKSLSIDDFKLFGARFNRTMSVESKGVVGIGNLVIKQKRPKTPARVPVVLTDRVSDLSTLEAARVYNLNVQPNLYNSNLFKMLENHPANLYKRVDSGKKGQELLNVHLSRRLQRTQRTLVLPAQVNMTLITNSYDVVHSWFLPSLGMKMDCVPGRSTHHSFFVDSFGFIYGQCAEICGRYHHHMPIRLCLLPFEHFLVWWQHFGLPRVLNLKPSNPEESFLPNSKFIW